jgi:hypothetical protein
MSSFDQVVAALAPPGMALVDADASVPRLPGLYAIYADAAVWAQLGLGDPPDTRPLYVGKAEGSLALRDLGTHFGDGRTGSSTVRRSFAALLREPLTLHAQPRNPAKPERFANYGLPPEDDQRLTFWMRANLRIAVWPKVGDQALVDTERAVLLRLEPPLNLTEIRTEWTTSIKARRAHMAREAEAANGR